MSDNINETQKEQTDSTNIFNDFVDDENLLKEVEQIKKEENKDLFYYILKFSSFLQFLFWIILLVALLLYYYTYIQNNEELSNSQILDPVCSIFTGEIEKPKDIYYCSSIAYLKNRYKKDLETTKKSYSDKILSMIEKVYEIDNFSNTRQVLFLVDKSKEKTKVLSVLDEFDSLKNKFNPLDKWKIQCNSLSIKSTNNSLSMVCTAYSGDYDRWIRWFDGSNEPIKLLKWSSLSIANSFINYIEKTSDKFEVVNKQKMFKSEPVISNKTHFTNKTVFNLELIYNIK